MKYFIWLLLLGGCVAAQDCITYSAPPLTDQPGQFGENVAICSGPSPGMSPAPCASLATVYADDVCRHASANPLRAGSKGTFTVNLLPGRYWYQVYGAGAQTYVGELAMASSNKRISSGSFETGQMHEYNSTIVGPGFDLTKEFQGPNNWFFSTDAVLGAVAVPSGATVTDGHGVGGYCTSAADSRWNTKSNTGVRATCSGAFFHARALANYSAVWGQVAVALDDPGIRGHTIIGNEIDMEVNGAPASVYGLIITGGVEPPAGIMPEWRSVGMFLSAGNKGTLQYGTGILLGRGVAMHEGILLDGQTLREPTHSQFLKFRGYDPTGKFHDASMNGDENGNLVLAPAPHASVFIANGVTRGGSGFQHVRVVSCTTSSSAFSKCVTKVQWPNAFADRDYTATCSIEPGSNSPMVANIVKDENALRVQVVNFSEGPSNGTINCIGVHD